MRDTACLELASIGEKCLVVHTKKTGARVEIPIDDPLFGGGELRTVLTEIVARTPPGSKFCFPVQRAQAIGPKSRASLCKSFQRVLGRHGIVGKRYHSIRHSYAVRLQAAGLSIKQIGQRLGHSTQAMTELYLNHDH